MAYTLEKPLTATLPISVYQQAMIEAACDPGTSVGYHQHMTIRWGFRIRPGLPARTLRRAFGKLVARHESLRLRFVERKGVWKAEVLVDHPTGVIVEDLTNLDEAAQKATIIARAGAPMTALSEPMFEMIIFRCGKGGDVLVTRVHHAIIDGYSVKLLIEDLLKFILSMPIGGSAPSHNEYIIHSQKRLGERAEEKETFWKAQLLPLPEELNIGRYAKGLPAYGPRTVGSSIRLDGILSFTQVLELERKAKEIGQSVFSLYCTAFSEAICELANRNEVLMNYVMGRHDREMSRFVGVNVDLGMVKYTSDGSSLVERAKRVSHSISKMSPNLPSTTFLPGGVLDKAFSTSRTQRRRFLVHQANVVSKLPTSSPFNKIFHTAMHSALSLGHVSLERFDLPGESETEFELYLLIEPQKEGLNANLIADSEGYSQTELRDIAHAVVRQLGL